MASTNMNHELNKFVGICDRVTNIETDSDKLWKSFNTMGRKVDKSNDRLFDKVERLGDKMERIDDDLYDIADQVNGNVQRLDDRVKATDDASATDVGILKERVRPLEVEAEVRDTRWKEEMDRRESAIRLEMAERRAEDDKIQERRQRQLMAITGAQAQAHRLLWGAISMIN